MSEQTKAQSSDQARDEILDVLGKADGNYGLILHRSNAFSSRDDREQLEDDLAQLRRVSAAIKAARDHDAETIKILTEALESVAKLAEIKHSGVESGRVASEALKRVREAEGTAAYENWQGLYFG